MVFWEGLWGFGNFGNKCFWMVCGFFEMVVLEMWFLMFFDGLGFGKNMVLGFWKNGFRFWNGFERVGFWMVLVLDVG